MVKKNHMILSVMQCQGITQRSFGVIKQLLKQFYYFEPFFVDNKNITFELSYFRWFSGLEDMINKFRRDFFFYLKNKGKTSYKFYNVKNLLTAQQIDELAEYGITITIEGDHILFA